MLTRILAIYGLYHVALLARNGGRAAASAGRFMKRKAPLISWLMELRKQVPTVTAAEIEAAKQVPVTFNNTTLANEDAARFIKARQQNLEVGRNGPGDSAPLLRHTGWTFEANELSVSRPAPIPGFVPVETPTQTKVSSSMAEDFAVAEILRAAGRSSSPVEAAKSAVSQAKDAASLVVGKVIDVGGNLASAARAKLGEADEAIVDTAEKAHGMWERNKLAIQNGSEEAIDTVTDHFEALQRKAIEAAHDAGEAAETAAVAVRDRIRAAVSGYVPTENGPFEAYVWEKVLPGTYVGHAVVIEPR